MKAIFSASLLIIFLFTSFTTIDAATITWLGGNAAWDDASQWDTGTVPVIGDDVIIPSGYCKIYNGDSEGATSVVIQSSARLYIYNGGILEIQGAVDNHGLHNMGRVYHYGHLAINSISLTNPSASANAIRNESRIYTYSSSTINIKYVDDIAIYNDQVYSYFRARGSIWTYSVSKTAIFNQDRFYNSGIISINNSGSSSGFMVSNTDDFRNLAGGEIELSSNIYGGISNGTPSANFRNYALIQINNAEVAFNNHGILTNYSGSSLIGEYNNASVLWNRENATISNYGLMKSNHSGAIIYNFGDLFNHKSFWSFGSTGNGSIRNFPTGFIDNYDDIYLFCDYSIDINNEGDIINRNGGIVEINKSIVMTSGSSFSNYGFIASHGSFPHNISGSFGNKGVIDDNQGLLQGLFPNDRVIVAPVSGPMQVGIPFPNVLDVASLDDIAIGNWKISPNGAIAGTYNDITNVFTPYASAIGVSTLYIVIQDLVSGFGRNFTLEIDSPILPFSKKNKKATTRNTRDLQNIKVFPNPSNGTIQLESEVLESYPTNVQVFNTMGQLVQQERFAEGSKKHDLDFSPALVNGLYFVKLFQNGKELSMKKIQLNR